MPRIIDVDTEAFAPTYQKAYKEREPIGDVQTRRMMADLQLVGQAMPYVSEGIKGIDQYVVTPIQQAMKESREEEYKAKKAGETPFDVDQKWMQPIAQQRAAEKEKPAVGYQPSVPNYIEEFPQFGSSMHARVQPLSSQARQEEWELPEEMKKAGFSDLRMIPSEEQEEPKRWLSWKAEPGVAGFPVSAKEKEEARAVAAPTGRGLTVFRDPRTGALRSVEPGAEFGRGSLGYELEASRQRTGLPPKPTTPTAEAPAPTEFEQVGHPAVTGVKVPPPRKPAEPGFAGAEAPADPTQTAQMAKTATTTARAGARTAAEPVAPTEPAKPKTLATVTDDELSDVKRRLEKMVEQNPEDKELADRLEMVNLEQRHRGEKMEYEDWAAMARAADTLEEQRKVLEMAKRVRMPVEGLESLLTSPFERAKLKALGARGERGLFPEVARPLNEWEIQKKQVEIRIGQLKAQGLPEKQAAEQALAELRQAKAGLAREQAGAIKLKAPLEAGLLGETIQYRHRQEEHLKNMDDIANQKAPNEIALMKARAANLMAEAKRRRSGGAGRGKDDLATMIKTLLSDDQQNVRSVAGMYGEASRTYSTILAQSMNDERDAASANADYEDLLGTGAGLYGPDKEQHELKVAMFKRKADDAKKKANLSKAQAEAAEKTLEQIDTQRAQASETARRNEAQVNALLETYAGRRGVPYKPREVTPAAPPARKTEQEGGIISAVRGVLGGGAKPAAAPAAPAKPAAAPAPTAATHKEGDESKDKKGRRIVWHNGEWTYPD